MKKNIFTTGLAWLMVLLASVKSNGQTLVPPTPSTDILWLGSAGLTVINTALIDIWNQNSDSNIPLKQLGACVYDGSGGGVVVTDFVSGCQVNTTFPVTGGSGYGIASGADVIIGNKSGSSADFIMAVVFVDNASTQQVEVNYFDIHYTSHTTFTVTFNSYQTLPVPPFGYAPLGTAHIDVVAQSSNLVATGSATTLLPFCDTFFVTYDSWRSLYPNRVSVTEGSLNAYNALVAGPQLINVGCSYSQDAWQPDVAGVERGATGGPFHCVACLTWIMGNSSWAYPNYYVYYSEWDPSRTGCASLSAYTILDGAPPISSTYPYFSKPRIDANDDYNTNSAIYCQSKVVCEAYNDPTFGGGGYHDVGIYNYNSPVSTGTTSSSWINLFGLIPTGTYIAPYNNRSPAVAYGQNGSTEFMVTQCSNDPVYGDFFMMSPIDQPCGSGVSYYGSSQYYFEVNSTYPATSSNYANSVSTPCNKVWDTSLVAWTNNGNIYYKRSGYGPSYGYDFRTTPTAIPGLSRGEEMVRIYPNPADNSLTVSNPSGVADEYSIKNLLGQQIMSGALPTGEQQVDVSSLGPGNYVASFYNNGMPAGNTIFVKK